MADLARMLEDTHLAASGLEDSADLELLAQTARKYLQHFRWCGPVQRLYFERGFKHCSVFYAVITPKGNADSELWLIVGDMPPLYMESQAYANGALALRGYANLWLAWVRAVREGKSIADFPHPVDAGNFEPLPITVEVVSMIESRMKFIKDKLLLTWPEDLR